MTSFLYGVMKESIDDGAYCMMADWTVAAHVPVLPGRARGTCERAWFCICFVTRLVDHGCTIIGLDLNQERFDPHIYKFTSS